MLAAVEPCDLSLTAVTVEHLHRCAGAAILLAFFDQVTATAMTKQMTQSFREEFGCLRCQELVAKNGGKGHCAHMIAWGAQRAEEILAENKVKE